MCKIKVEKISKQILHTHRLNYSLALTPVDPPGNPHPDRVPSPPGAKYQLGLGAV